MLQGRKNGALQAPVLYLDGLHYNADFSSIIIITNLKT
jgi:hypothetical protein